MIAGIERKAAGAAVEVESADTTVCFHHTLKAEKVRKTGYTGTAVVGMSST